MQPTQGPGGALEGAENEESSMHPGSEFQDGLGSTL